MIRELKGITKGERAQIGLFVADEMQLETTTAGFCASPIAAASALVS
jgi:hypothetical protein